MIVNEEVLAVLSSAAVNGSHLVLTQQLDRNMYVQTNKVLEAAGGKWDRKAKAHVFPFDAATRLDQIILSGSIDIPKDEFNFFPTPPEIVKHLLEISDIEPGMRVLEPSAGIGNIATACAELGGSVDCYELMADNFCVLSANPALASVKHTDFLTQAPEPIYDRVVMNPPFAKQADIKHVLHALKFLKANGLLTSIMSAGVAFRENKMSSDFRALVQARGGFLEKLPEASFKSSGTMVNTVIVSVPA